MTKLIGSVFGLLFACILATLYFCLYLLCTYLRTAVFAVASAALVCVIHGFCAMITGMMVGCFYGRPTGEHAFLWMLCITGGLHAVLTLTVVCKFAYECMTREGYVHRLDMTQFDLWDRVFHNLCWQIFWPAGYILRLMDGKEVSIEY